MSPHPHAGEEWFERLPPERQLEMTREHEASLRRPDELEALTRRRMRVEALQMGGVFALFGWFCGNGWTLLASAVVGTALGWVCSRLDWKRLATALAGMVVFLVSQCALNSSSVLIVMVFPLGACCALLGWIREERGYC